jgi:hypothetical protein
MSNCIKIGSFGATDIQRAVGQRHQHEPLTCTRFLLEFRSRKRFANHVCSGRFGNKLGGRFSKNRFVFSTPREF